MFKVFAIGIAVTASTPSYAHWGHLGDLAGHSHWVGLGAVVVAGVLGSLLGQKAGDEDTNEPETSMEDEPEGEGASA